MNRFLNGVARAVTEAFDLPGPVLEIGSYQVPGQEAIADLRALFPGQPYIGVDVRPGPGVDCVADVEALPQPDASVGTVIAMNTFEHVPCFWRGFEEIHRVLRPDGVLLVSCPFYFHIHNYPSDYWRFTPEALELLLRDYPSRVIGRHGPAKRPAGVWAVAFREGRPAPTRAELDRYKELLGRYARQPLPWARRLRYRLGRLLCGARPFAPYLEQEHWQIQVRAAAAVRVEPVARAAHTLQAVAAHAVAAPAGVLSAVTGGPDDAPRPFAPDSQGTIMSDLPRTPTTDHVPAPAPRTDLDSSPRGERTVWWQSFLDQEPVDVSVCIANWNCRELLRRCLESLHDQPQGVRLETIVVDNASADGAAEMVAREFPEVRLHRNTVNAGFARANNQAARYARGRYLFFLNNDTVVPPGALRRLVEFLEARPDVGMVGPLLRDGQGHRQTSYRLQPTMAIFLHRTCLLRCTGLLRRAYHRYRRQDLDASTPRPVEVLLGAAVLLPREVFLDCGRWDEDFHFGGEDLDLCYRVGRRHPLVYFPQVEITHFGRVSTKQHIRFASSQIEVGFVRYLRKLGYSEPALYSYKAVMTLDAPLHCLVKGLQYVVRRLRGQPAKAEKSWLALRGLGHFLRSGLLPFWKA